MAPCQGQKKLRFLKKPISNGPFFPVGVARAANASASNHSTPNGTYSEMSVLSSGWHVTVSDGFRRYPTVSDGIKVPRESIRRYPTVFDGIRRYPTVAQNYQFFSMKLNPTVSDGIRRYPTVPWFSPRRYPTVAGFRPAGNPAAGFLSTGILAACLHSPERLGTDCLPGQDG